MLGNLSIAWALGGPSEKNRLACEWLWAKPKRIPPLAHPPGRQEWVLDTQFLLQALANERVIIAPSWAWAVVPE